MVLISNESSLVHLIMKPIITISRMMGSWLKGNSFLIPVFMENCGRRQWTGNILIHMSSPVLEATSTGLAIVSHYHMWMCGATWVRRAVLERACNWLSLRKLKRHLKRNLVYFSTLFHDSCSYTPEQWSCMLNLPGFSTQIMDIQPITNLLHYHHISLHPHLPPLHWHDLTSLPFVTEAMQTHRYTHT